MRMPSILKSTILAAAATVLGAGAALAGPTIGGINIPSNLYLDTTLSYETLVDPSVGANTLRGVFFVNTIVDSSNAQTTYTVGQNNKWLTGYFDNFQFSAANSDSTHLAFTGGTLKYYVQTAASNPFRNDLGSDNLDIANASLGTLWLDIAPVADATTGVTLVITLTGGGATTFLDSHAFALGDVIGGLAAPALDSNAINGHDILFTGQANRTIGGSCGPDFGVCGANNARALVIPEPITLSLFGAGLAGAAALRRRKVKKA